MLVSEASRAVSWGGGKGGGAWYIPLMSPFHDTRFWYWLVKRLHVDRFAVLLTVLGSFNITHLQFGKRYFKTRILSKQYKFLYVDFSLIPRLQEEQKICLWSVSKKKKKKKHSKYGAFLILCCDKLWSHLQSDRLINYQRSKGTVLSRSYIPKAW